MKITRDEAKRLGFAKYLLNLGNREITRHEPLSSSGLLFYHDATELLLDIVSTHLNLTTKSCAFMEYWKLIKPPHIASPGLPQEKEFDKLNRARVALKHHGLHPSRSELGDFKGVVQRFFETTIKIVFDETLDSISLTEFISDNDVRELVTNATTALHGGDSYGATVKAAEAFDLLCKGALGRIGGRGRHDALLLPQIGNPPHIYRRENGPADSNAHEFFSSVKKALEALQDSVKVLSLGLDFQNYARFFALTPEVVTFLGGQTKVLDRHRGQKPEVSTADAEFCIEFVISSAFELQERAYTPPTFRSQ